MGKKEEKEGKSRKGVSIDNEQRKDFAFGAKRSRPEQVRNQKKGGRGGKKREVRPPKKEKPGGDGLTAEGRTGKNVDSRVAPGGDENKWGGWDLQWDVVKIKRAGRAGGSRARSKERSSRRVDLLHKAE